MHPKIEKAKIAWEHGELDQEQRKIEYEKMRLKIKEWWEGHEQCFRAATPDDYIGWLRKWVDTDGEITHYYNYDMPSEFLVAISHIKIPIFYGAASIGVIVPTGITVGFEEIGHNNIYQLAPLNQFGGFVPCYRNTEF